MFKKSRVRGSFDKWHGEQSEALLKSKRRHLYHIYWSLGRQLSWKKSLLMICKILGLFVNLLTGDEKYSVLKRRNLFSHIPMHLSQKRKMFSQVFFFDFHGKRVEALFKAEQQNLYHIYWSLWMQFRFKKLQWVRWKILELFVNPFAADIKYSLVNRGNLLQYFQMQLSHKQKIFLNFFFLYFLNLDSIVKIF